MTRFCRSCGARLARDHDEARCESCQTNALQATMAPPEVPAEFWAVAQLQQALASRHIGHIARAYRLHPFHAPVFGPRGITQSVLADWLGLTQPQVCRVENGPPIRDLDRLAHWARTLRIPPEHLWFEQPSYARTPLANDPPQADVESPVYVSQHQWRTVRRYLNAHRAELAHAASGLYPPTARLRDTPLLARAGWIPRPPVRLEDVEPAWVDDPPPAAVDGCEPEVHGVLPLRTSRRRYDRYTSAIRYVDAPALFENRASYRLLDLAWTDNGRGRMAFGPSTYFEKLDISEAVGHELAAVRMREEHRGAKAEIPSARQHWGQLPFRRLIGDPCDLGARSVIPAISTLVLRRQENGDASFLMHWRDPAKVATAGGLYDVMPAGEFQPAGIGPPDRTDDFDLWRNIVRELSEELLGTPEHDGSHSGPLAYEQWPLYRALRSARCQGRLHAWCLGVGCDALTLAATIPTVLVIDEPVFAEVFGEIVPANAEGVAIIALPGERPATGIPFTKGNVSRFLQREPLAAPGAACLALAWRHRDALLA